MSYNLGSLNLRTGRCRPRHVAVEIGSGIIDVCIAGWFVEVLW